MGNEANAIYNPSLLPVLGNAVGVLVGTGVGVLFTLMLSVQLPPPTQFPRLSLTSKFALKLPVL